MTVGEVAPKLRTMRCSTTPTAPLQNSASYCKRECGNMHPSHQLRHELKIRHSALPGVQAGLDERLRSLPLVSNFSCNTYLW